MVRVRQCTMADRSISPCFRANTMMRTYFLLALGSSTRMRHERLCGCGLKRRLAETRGTHGALKKLMTNIEIIPAIMPKSYDDLVEKMGLFAGVVPIVQLDIMDGKFVPERTWPYPLARDPHFDAIVDQEEGMPAWEDVNFEVDLMIENPELMVPKWISAGVSRAIVHVESMGDFEKIREAVPTGLIELGLAINT